MSINFAVIGKPIESVHKIARAAVSEFILNLASVKFEINRDNADVKQPLMGFIKLVLISVILELKEEIF